LPGSTHHRLVIWRFTAERIAERPFLGWGFDGSRSVPGGDEDLGVGETALPLHPHNAALQWWLELGLPGAAIGAAFLLALVRAIVRDLPDRPSAAAALGLLVSGTVVANVSYGIWQGWWLAALALSAALMVAVANDSR
jgi:O-antigen ligase